jgi:gas vesicle protein
MADIRLGKYQFSKRSTPYFTALGVLAVGAALGALAALLVAPKTGKQLRKDVRRKYEEAREAMEDLSDRAGEIWERGEELADAARRKAEPVTRRVFRRA